MMHWIRSSRKLIGGGWLRRLWFRRFDQNLRDVRPARLMYMLIFPLAPVFANMQESVLLGQPRLWGLDAMSLMGAAYCLGAGVLFAFAKPGSLRLYARWLSLTALLFYVVWLVLPAGHVSLMVSLAFMVCFGGCAGIAAFGFSYALNDAERLLGAALVSLFCVLWQLDFALGWLSGLFSRAYLTALVLGTTVCLNLYRTEDYARASEHGGTRLNAPLLLMLFFFFAHKAAEVFYTYLPGASATNALVANAVMGILVFIGSLLLYFRARFSLWHMCNLFFLGMIVSLLLRFLAPSPLGQAAARYAHGLEQMGFIASYCLLGMTLQRHAGVRLFKGIIFFALLGAMLLYMVPGQVKAHAPDALPLWTAWVTGGSFILFIALSPAYVRYVFPQPHPSGELLAAVAAPPPQPAVDPMAGLSPREREICLMLLDGLLIKECAGQLGISTDTAKFHTRNLYRKLNINSRSQLHAALDRLAHPEAEKQGAQADTEAGKVSS